MRVSSPGLSLFNARESSLYRAAIAQPRSLSCSAIFAFACQEDSSYPPRSTSPHLSRNLNVTCIHHEYLPRTVCSTMWREYSPVFHILVYRVEPRWLGFNDTSISPFESEFLPSRFRRRKGKLATVLKVRSEMYIRMRKYEEANFRALISLALQKFQNGNHVQCAIKNSCILKFHFSQFWRT